jgi:hypothetical protein
VADRTWKAFERRVARAFGTERIPAAGVMGKAQLDAPDFETSLIVAQVKKGYNPPSYLRSWLDGIVGQGQRVGRRGVVIWGGKGVKDDDAFVVMRLADFVELHRQADEPTP